MGRPDSFFPGRNHDLASLVLLAACANLGSIFAVRAADRSRELAIRLSIGSSRWNILRGLLTEAVMVSLWGGSWNVVFRSVAASAEPLASFRRISYPCNGRSGCKGLPDCVAVVSGQRHIVWLLPARQIQRSDAAQVIKSGGNAVTNFRRFALRDMLLCIQIALCTLLVTGSLVALRGMERSLHAPLGFQPEGVTLAATELSMGGYGENQYLPIQTRMLEETARLPGVSAVGIIGRNLLGSDCCGSSRSTRGHHRVPFVQ